MARTFGMWGAFAMILGAAACATSSKAPPASASLPISKVVLYQNGIGYFERSGEVKESRVVLSVRPEHMNDLLKSLTVIDEGGGRAVNEKPYGQR